MLYVAIRIPDERIGQTAPVSASEHVRLIGHVAGKRVLELGCGPGSAAVDLALQGAKVIAVDTDEGRLAAVRRAAEGAETKVELHHGDVADLAFLRADTIDAVFSDLVLAEVPDLPRVFRQAHRILRPEAPLVFSLPHPGTGGDAGGGRSISDVFMALIRTNFRVDHMLEPGGRTLVLRGRKEGV
jgi:SAM-dependent methyltransferase